MALVCHAYPMVEHTPVRARRGRRVHANLYYTDTQSTACRRPCSGWLITDQPVDCPICKKRLI